MCPVIWTHGRGPLSHSTIHNLMGTYPVIWTHGRGPLSHSTSHNLMGMCPVFWTHGRRPLSHSTSHTLMGMCPMIWTHGRGPLCHSTSHNLMGMYPMIWTHGRRPLSHSTSLNLMGMYPVIWTHGRRPLSTPPHTIWWECILWSEHMEGDLSPTPPHSIWWECILWSEHMEGDLSPTPPHSIWWECILWSEHMEGDLSPTPPHSIWWEPTLWSEHMEGTSLPLHLTQSDGNVSCVLNTWKETSLHSTSHTLMGMYPVFWTHGRRPLSTPPHTLWWECVLWSEHMEGDPSPTPPHTIWWECILWSELMEGDLSPLHLTHSDGNVSCDLNSWKGTSLHSTSHNLMGMYPVFWTHRRRPLSTPPHTIWWECVLWSEHMEGDLSPTPPHSIWWECILWSELMEGDLSPLHLTHSDGNVSYDLNTWKETPLPLHLTQSDGNVSCDLNSWKGTSLHSTSHTLMGMYPVFWTHGRRPLSTPPHTLWWECILCSEHMEGDLSPTPPHTLWWECVLWSEHMEGDLSPLHLTHSDGNVSCVLNTWKETSLHSTSHTLMGMYPVFWTHGRGPLSHSTSHNLMGMYHVIRTHGGGPLSFPPHTLWWECFLWSELIEGGLSPLHLTQSDGNVSCDLNTWIPLSHSTSHNLMGMYPVIWTHGRDLSPTPPHTLWWECVLWSEHMEGDLSATPPHTIWWECVLWSEHMEGDLSATPPHTIWWEPDGLCLHNWNYIKHATPDWCSGCDVDVLRKQW